MNHKKRRLQVGAWLFAEPSDDCHTAIITFVVDELLASQVMVEVDLVPRFS
jgi:hypothetical protein